MSLQIKWIRGNDKLPLDRPFTLLVQGVRGSGKSSLLERLGEISLKRGHTVFDMFGARDGCAQWRAPRVTEKI